MSGGASGDDPVRIGILSAAHIHTNGYAAKLSELEEIEFVGVADDDIERGRKCAESFNTSLLPTNDLLERTDGVVVSSTNTTHERWATAAADAGVDVLCEKPLGTTLETARRIVNYCEDAGVNLGMCMPLPFSEASKRARRAYEAGRIGSLVSATGTNRAWLRNRHVDGWSATPEHSGGGAVMDHTVHIVDLVRWITGEEVTEVMAELTTMHEGLEVEDVNLLSMRLSNGAMFTLDGSWNRPENWDYWGDATLELIGTDGELAVDCFDQTYRLTRDSGDNQGISKVYWGSLPNEGLLLDFADAVANGRKPAITGRDGLRETAVCVAAYESAKRGEPVSVEY